MSKNFRIGLFAGVFVLTILPALRMSCSTIPDDTGGVWTTSFKDIQNYDQLKVNAVLHRINGRTQLGGSKAPVPVIFGMNFQAVGVGQKLIENGTFGGYTDAAGDPTPSMLSEIESTTKACSLGRGDDLQSKRTRQLCHALLLKVLLSWPFQL